MTSQLSFAPVFQDRAVLQRGAPIAVWGQSLPGLRITVTLSDSLAVTSSSSRGDWFVRLPSLPAGGPHQLRVEDETGASCVCDDILVGDVWICSGQSNMEWINSLTDPDSANTAGLSFPRLRLLTVKTTSGSHPQSEVAGIWAVADERSLPVFSSVASWFGRSLQAEVEVPIGLIANAWGGTRIQAWISREGLMQIPEGQREVLPYERELYAPANAEAAEHYSSVDEWFQAEGPEDPENLGERDGWHQAGFDDSAWPTMSLPSRWQDHGHAEQGIFWFRLRVSLPADLRGKELSLRPGAIDKHDQTYVDGVLVGSMGWENPTSWCTPRFYTVPSALTAGKTELTLAVRVRSHIFHGGLIGPAEAMELVAADGSGSRVSLTGAWRYAREQNFGVVTPPAIFSNQGPGGCNSPYAMFVSRNAPLLPYTIKGWLWYQGESNASEPELYEKLFPAMIADWRRAWGQGELPFLFVQLANYMAPATFQPASTWARLREAQRRTAETVSQTGMAVIIDAGDADDIHPRDKRTVGERLARLALTRVYGLPGLAGGPRALRAQREGKGLRVIFADAAGLRTRDGKPVSHLALAGPKGDFYPAQGEIQGESVLVFCDKVEFPSALRYAWADNPEGCNLENEDALPASPFELEVN